MRIRLTFRASSNSARPLRTTFLAGAAASALLVLAAPATLAQSSSQVLDRVVAVVNNQAILWSDITSEQRFSVLDPQGANGNTAPAKTLQQLIGRALIQQQIRQEDATAAQPADKEVQDRLDELRKELPACIRLHCSTDEGWHAFLNANGLTTPQIENYLRLRLEILRFIEIRFRQGIRISPEATQAYYREKLVPQYAKGAPVPPLSAVAPRIEEILLEEQVNVLFGNWLDSLRKQGDVEVLDPALEPDTEEPAAGSVGVE